MLNWGIWKPNKHSHFTSILKFNVLFFDDAESFKIRKVLGKAIRPLAGPIRSQPLRMKLPNGATQNGIQKIKQRKLVPIGKQNL